jgi:hypothetical protein
VQVCPRFEVTTTCEIIESEFEEGSAQVKTTTSATIAKGARSCLATVWGPSDRPAMW